MFILSRKIETSVVSHFMDLVEEADKDKNGKIDFEEWEFMGEFFGHVHLGSTLHDRNIFSLKNYTSYPYG